MQNDIWNCQRGYNRDGYHQPNRSDQVKRRRVILATGSRQAARRLPYHKGIRGTIITSVDSHRVTKKTLIPGCADYIDRRRPAVELLFKYQVECQSARLCMVSADYFSSDEIMMKNLTMISNVDSATGYKTPWHFRNARVSVTLAQRKVGYISIIIIVTLYNCFH